MTGHPNFCKDWHRIVSYQIQSYVLKTPYGAVWGLRRRYYGSIDKNNKALVKNITIFDMDGIGWQWFDKSTGEAGYTTVIAPDSKCCWDTFSDQFAARNYTITGPSGTTGPWDYYGLRYERDELCEKSPPYMPRAMGPRPPMPPAAPKPPEAPDAPPFNPIPPGNYTTPTRPPYFPPLPKHSPLRPWAPPQPGKPPSFPGKWAGAWAPHHHHYLLKLHRFQTVFTFLALQPASPASTEAKCDLSAKQASFTVPRISRGTFYIAISVIGQSNLLYCKTCGCSVMYAVLARGVSSLYLSSSSAAQVKQANVSDGDGSSIGVTTSSSNTATSRKFPIGKLMTGISTDSVTDSGPIIGKEAIIPHEQHEQHEQQLIPAGNPDHGVRRRAAATASDLPSLEDLIMQDGNSTTNTTRTDGTVLQEMATNGTGKGVDSLAAAWRMQPGSSGDYLLRIQVAGSVWWRWVVVDIDPPYATAQLSVSKTTVTLENPLMTGEVTPLRYMLVQFTTSEPVQQFDLGSTLQLSESMTLLSAQCFKSSKAASEIAKAATTITVATVAAPLPPEAAPAAGLPPPTLAAAALPNKIHVGLLDTFGLPYVQSCLAVVYASEGSKLTITLPDGTIKDLAGNPSSRLLLLETELTEATLGSSTSAIRGPAGSLVSNIITSATVAAASASSFSVLSSRLSMLQSAYHIQILAMTASLASPGVSLRYRQVAGGLRWSVAGIKGNIPILDSAFGNNPRDVDTTEQANAALGVNLQSISAGYNDTEVRADAPSAWPASPEVRQPVAAFEASILRSALVRRSLVSALPVQAPSPPLETPQMPLNEMAEVQSISPMLTSADRTASPTPSDDEAYGIAALLSWLQSMSEFDPENGSNVTSLYIIGGAAIKNGSVAAVDPRGRGVFVNGSFGLGNSTAGESSSVGVPANPSSAKPIIQIGTQDIVYTLCTAAILMGGLLIGHLAAILLYRACIGQKLPTPLHFPRLELTLAGPLLVAITFYASLTLGLTAKNWNKSRIIALLVLLLIVFLYIFPMWWLTVCRWYLRERSDRPTDAPAANITGPHWNPVPAAADGPAADKPSQDSLGMGKEFNGPRYNTSDDQEVQQNDGDGSARNSGRLYSPLEPHAGHMGGKVEVSSPRRRPFSSIMQPLAGASAVASSTSAQEDGLDGGRSCHEPSKRNELSEEVDANQKILPRHRLSSIKLPLINLPKKDTRDSSLGASPISHHQEEQTEDEQKVPYVSTATFVHEQQLADNKVNMPRASGGSTEAVKVEAEGPAGQETQQDTTGRSDHALMTSPAVGKSKNEGMDASDNMSGSAGFGPPDHQVKEVGMIYESSIIKHKLPPISLATSHIRESTLASFNGRSKREGSMQPEHGAAYDSSAATCGRPRFPNMPDIAQMAEAPLRERIQPSALQYKGKVHAAVTQSSSKSSGLLGEAPSLQPNGSTVADMDAYKGPAAALSPGLVPSESVLDKPDVADNKCPKRVAKCSLLPRDDKDRLDAVTEDLDSETISSHQGRGLCQQSQLLHTGRATEPRADNSAGHTIKSTENSFIEEDATHDGTLPSPTGTMPSPTGTSSTTLKQHRKSRPLSALYNKAHAPTGKVQDAPDTGSDTISKPLIQEFPYMTSLVKSSARKTSSGAAVLVSPHNSTANAHISRDGNSRKRTASSFVRPMPPPSSSPSSKISWQGAFPAGIREPAGVPPPSFIVTPTAEASFTAGRDEAANNTIGLYGQQEKVFSGKEGMGVNSGLMVAAVPVGEAIESSNFANDNGAPPSASSPSTAEQPPPAQRLQLLPPLSPRQITGQIFLSQQVTESNGTGSRRKPTKHGHGYYMLYNLLADDPLGTSSHDQQQPERPSLMDQQPQIAKPDQAKIQPLGQQPPQIQNVRRLKPLRHMCGPGRPHPTIKLSHLPNRTRDRIATMNSTAEVKDGTSTADKPSDKDNNSVKQLFEMEKLTAVGTDSQANSVDSLQLEGQPSREIRRLRAQTTILEGRSAKLSTFRLRGDAFAASAPTETDKQLLALYPGKTIPMFMMHYRQPISWPFRLVTPPIPFMARFEFLFEDGIGDGPAQAGRETKLGLSFGILNFMHKALCAFAFGALGQRRRSVLQLVFLCLPQLAILVYLATLKPFYEWQRQVMELVCHALELLLFVCAFGLLNSTPDNGAATIYFMIACFLLTALTVITYQTWQMISILKEAWTLLQNLVANKEWAQRIQCLRCLFLKKQQMEDQDNQPSTNSRVHTRDLQ
ncbi:hypothetical protein VOLCADRAFT_95896 [Volvox carteri f. nagariensis]|uniref:Uncharacterized protein n=1 Tax=Volvox carteri f. nagariensis TaxID=3068 RepID=D8U8N3_VOLCA|nr:uncharacterized protein VOLCADRAFT_95896 [Volvox carteri f. nagariensis]EFJ43952.1 hypothetical protein VOLCADRAFT_95896 [Volvox carteri f. nagariensis]|eukprot:XP_002954964.1 hypothetical protein VOLCADRAFT_95896 [Volvox carteri f. nagariensis]